MGNCSSTGSSRQKKGGTNGLVTSDKPLAVDTLAVACRTWMSKWTVGALVILQIDQRKYEWNNPVWVDTAPDDDSKDTPPILVVTGIDEEKEVIRFRTLTPVICDNVSHDRVLQDQTSGFEIDVKTKFSRLRFRLPTQSELDSGNVPRVRYEECDVFVPISPFLHDWVPGEILSVFKDLSDAKAGCKQHKIHVTTENHGVHTMPLKTLDIAPRFTHSARPAIVSPSTKMELAVLATGSDSGSSSESNRVPLKSITNSTLAPTVVAIPISVLPSVSVQGATDIQGAIDTFQPPAYQEIVMHH